MTLGSRNRCESRASLDADGPRALNIPLRFRCAQFRSRFSSVSHDPSTILRNRRAEHRFAREPRRDIAAKIIGSGDNPFYRSIIVYRRYLKYDTHRSAVYASYARNCAGNWNSESSRRIGYRSVTEQPCANGSCASCFRGDRGRSEVNNRQQLVRANANDKRICRINQPLHSKQ